MLPILLVVLVVLGLLALAFASTQRGRAIFSARPPWLRRPPRVQTNGPPAATQTTQAVVLAAPPDPSRPVPRRRAADRRNLGLLAVMVIGLLSTIVVLRLMSTDADQFVVLVAPFREPDGSLGQTGRTVAAQLVDDLNRRGDSGLVARVLDNPPADAAQALKLMDREDADVLLWGTVASGAMANQDALQPLLAYRPTGTFAPAAWDNYTARFAMPTTYVLTGSTLNGAVVLPPLVTALADYSAGNMDAAFTTLGGLLDTYPALAAPLPRALRGNMLWARGEYSAAEDEYRRTGVLNAAPGSAWQVALLANNLGAILQDAGDPLATEILGRAETMLGGQDLGELRVNQALAALHQGDTNAAVQRLARAQQLLPASAPLLLALAEAERANGQFEQAQRTLDAANSQIDLDLRTVPAGYQPLVSSRLQATVLETRAMLQFAAPIEGRDPLLWEFQDERSLVQQQALTAKVLTEVRNTAQQAVDTTADLARRWNHRAVSEDAAGRSVSGLLANAQARRAENTLRERQRFLGAIEIELGEAEDYRPPTGFGRLWQAIAGDRSPVGQGRAMLEGLIASQPDDVDSAVLLGHALLLSGDTAAGKRFDTAANAAPQRPEPVYGQALVALASDRAKGRLLLQQAISLDGHYYPAREKLAAISEQDHDWALALQQRQALERQRSNAATRLDLARALRLSGPSGYVEAEAILLPLANRSDPNALLELGRLYRAYGNNQAARNALERAGQIAPRNAEVAYELGQTLVGVDDTAAEAQFKIAVDANPRYTDAQLALGKLYAQHNRPEASAAYTAALDSGLNDPLALKQLGAALMEDKVYDKAQEAYERAVRAAPQDWEAYHGLGQAHLRQGQFDAARTAEQQALNLRTGAYPQALVALGDIALENGDPAGAVAQYNAALKLDPQLTAASLGLGRAAAAQNNWAVARGYFQNAVDRDATSAEARLWLGEALIRLEDTPGAIAAYQKALELRPEYAEAYFGLAQAQIAAKQLDPAADNLQRAIQRRANYAEAYLLQGKLFEQQSRASDAIVAYGNAVQANKSFAEPYYRRALLYIRSDRVSDAETDLLQAIKFQPNFPEAHYWLGRTYLVDNRTSDARAQFQLAVQQRNGSYPEALFYQGQAEEQLGQRTAAADSFRTALNQDRNSSWATDAQNALSRLGQ